MNPAVSVIMPVFNAEEYLGEAIESILSQTFKDFEFIIIDDGSTDSSADLISDFKTRDARIQYIRNDQNIGIAHSLNKGLQMAKGQYIVRMDADDISLPDRIRKQVNYMDSNTDVGVSSGWMLSIGRGKNKIWKCPGNHEEIWARMFCRCSIWQPAVIMRTSVLNEHDLYYNEDFKRAEDYDLWVRMAQVAKLGNLQEVLVKYRIHPNQISRKDDYSHPIRLRIVEAFLDRTLTAREEYLHNLFFSISPKCSFEELIQIEEWKDYLKSVNSQKKYYVEPYFSTVLGYEFQKMNRNWFYQEISEATRYTPLILKKFFKKRGHLLFTMPLKDTVKIVFKSLLWYPNNYNN